MGKSPSQLHDEIVENQHRARLRARIQRLINKWEPILGVHVSEWGLRKMKTYWGSTDPNASKMTFDSKLSGMSAAFLEITVVHELMHLVTKDGGHDDRFYQLMDRHVPNWRRLHAKYAGTMTPQS